MVLPTFLLTVARPLGGNLAALESKKRGQKTWEWGNLALQKLRRHQHIRLPSRIRKGEIQ